jgi:hypothetical protein
MSVDETQLQYFMACSKKGDVEGLMTSKLNANVVDELGNTGVFFCFNSFKLGSLGSFSRL